MGEFREALGLGQAGLVSLVGTHLHALPEVGARARTALAAAGVPVLSSLETDGRLSVQTEPERGGDALLCLHRLFLEA